VNRLIRGVSFALFNRARNLGWPIQARFWLEWDTQMSHLSPLLPTSFSVQTQPLLIWVRRMRSPSPVTAASALQGASETLAEPYSPAGNRSLADNSCRARHLRESSSAQFSIEEVRHIAPRSCDSGNALLFQKQCGKSLKHNQLRLSPPAQRRLGSTSSSHSSNRSRSLVKEPPGSAP